MIFGQLFKKIKDTKMGQKDTITQHTQKQPQQKNSKIDAQPTEKTVKKTKLQRKNKTANTQRRKKRSNRMVHTKRSFHPKTKQPAEKQVNNYDVIERPVITEKAANQSEKNIYTFIVRREATKHSVADAIETLYNVKPKKVHIAKRPPKKKRIRIPSREREHGITATKKKAYVFLREGDKIQLT